MRRTRSRWQGRRLERRLTRSCRCRWRSRKRDRAWWRLKTLQSQTTINPMHAMRPAGAIIFSLLLTGGALSWVAALFSGLFYLLWIGVSTVIPFHRAFDSRGLAIFFFYPTSRQEADRRLVGRARWANLDWFLVAVLITGMLWSENRFAAISGIGPLQFFFGLLMLGLLGLGLEPFGRKFWSRVLLPAIGLVCILGLFVLATNGTPNVQQPVQEALELLAKFTPVGWLFAPLFGLLPGVPLLIYGIAGVIGAVLLWNRRHFAVLPSWKTHFPHGWTSPQADSEATSEAVAGDFTEKGEETKVSSESDCDIKQRMRSIKRASLAAGLREERERTWATRTLLDRCVFRRLSRQDRVGAEWVLGLPPGWRLPWKFPAAALFLVVVADPAWWSQNTFSTPVGLIEVLRIVIAAVTVMLVGWYDLRMMVPALRGAVVNGRRFSVCAFQPVTLRDLSRWIRRLMWWRLAVAIPWLVAFLLSLLPMQWWTKAAMLVVGGCVLIAGTFLLTVPGYLARMQSRRVGWFAGIGGESLLVAICVLGVLGGASLTTVLWFSGLLPGGPLGVATGYGIAASSMAVLAFSCRNISRGRGRDFLTAR